MATGEHIAAEVLLDYIENRADEETMARVRTHLSTGCAHCAEEMAHWTCLLGVLRRCGATAPPEAAVERAIAISDRESDCRSLPTQAWWEGITTPLTPAALEGIRGTIVATIHLLFRASDTDIDLLCERKGGDWHIVGQALSSTAPEAGWAVFAAGAGRQAVTRTDARGEFYLSRLPPGIYELALCGSNRAILLPEVRLEGVRF